MYREKRVSSGDDLEHGPHIELVKNMDSDDYLEMILGFGDLEHGFTRSQFEKWLRELNQLKKELCKDG